MNDDIKKVLDLLEEGRITKAEAVELIEALKESSSDKTAPEGKRFMKITVTENGQKKVNVKIPIRLINFGLSAWKLTGGNKFNIDGENIPIDVDELKKAIEDPDFYGKIVDVDDSEKGEHVEIEII